MPTLPPSFLVQPIYQINRLSKWPGKPTWALWDQLSFLAPMKALDEDAPNTLIRAAWHNDGLAFGIEVTGKHQPATSYDDSPSDSDSVGLFLDLRNTKGIHRASRFCHSFRLVPFEEGGASNPLVVQEPIGRAREDAPFRDLKTSAISEKTKAGYRMIALLPAANLNGFDPKEVDRLGFFALRRDSELGDEPFTGDLLLPSSVDPSLWSTVVFTDAAST